MMPVVQLILEAVRSDRWEVVEELCRRLISFDVETWCIAPGLAAPPLVCGSVAHLDDAGLIQAELHDKRGAREVFRALLADEDLVFVGQNPVFDCLVMVRDAHEHEGLDLLPDVWRMYEQGRVFDVQIAQMLGAIADGMLNKDPFTGRGMQKRYNLAEIVRQVLNRTDAKQNDKWKKRYAELEHVPIELWPVEAREYPKDDARNTLEVALAQLGAAPKTTKHVWGRRGCDHCGSTTLASWCVRAGTPHANLHEIHNQCETHWAMYLGAAWGFKVDQSAVRRIAEQTRAERTAALPQFVEAGMIRSDGTKDTARINRMIAEAYDAIGMCGKCSGTAKMPSPKTGKPINCDACSATGLDMSRAPDVPRTPTDKVSRARDVLDESGEEILIEFADYSRLAKTEETYLPYLADAGEKPLILKPNPLLETDRTSYGDKIGQFPRQGDLRSCIVAREATYEIAEVPDDYVLKPGEEIIDDE